MRTLISVFAVLATVLASAVAAQDSAKEPGSIVVIGNRAEQAEVAANQAKAITLRPSIDEPLPRRYAPICIKLLEIDPAYGQLIAEQIRHNARILGHQVGKTGCQPNVWIGFFRNSKGQVEQLRKSDPVMFATLKSFEVERIFRGSGAAQAWHSTEIRNVDGRPFPIVVIFGRKVKLNTLYQAGRLVSPIRNDINGTIIIFDRERANGRTVQQLADYATFRILAPVQDYDKMPEGVAPTILQLFAEGAATVDGLTEFDWAYLSAFYKLDRGAKASAVHDATRKAMLDGTGQRLREKSGEP